MRYIIQGHNRDALRRMKKAHQYRAMLKRVMCATGPAYKLSDKRIMAAKKRRGEVA